MLLADAKLAAVIDGTGLPGCCFDPVLERNPGMYAGFIAECTLAGCWASRELRE